MQIHCHLLGTPAKELYDTASVSPDQIPELNKQFLAHLGSRRERDVLSETQHLPIVCLHFLLDLQHSVPDAALIDLLEIEIDAVIVKRSESLLISAENQKVVRTGSFLNTVVLS